MLGQGGGAGMGSQVCCLYSRVWLSTGEGSHRQAWKEGNSWMWNGREIPSYQSSEREHGNPYRGDEGPTCRGAMTTRPPRGEGSGSELAALLVLKGIWGPRIHSYLLAFTTPYPSWVVFFHLISESTFFTLAHENSIHFVSIEPILVKQTHSGLQV